ncbi:hypothetical protein BS50DRAFT_378168 [Corynespora cassiicola Philippines]|uniref:Uncharacterized protein n=1 Tax=Corynespora cassiicola Philippines TaxID=1448308 RepID=A0A2T2NNB0_CORCC|nr:hypothetical protein BS50DRAFT_378168 [Corynespora cassiicola Philippines]
MHQLPKNVNNLITHGQPQNARNKCTIMSPYLLRNLHPSFYARLEYPKPQTEPLQANNTSSQSTTDLPPNPSTHPHLPSPIPITKEHTISKGKQDTRPTALIHVPRK